MLQINNARSLGCYIKQIRKSHKLMQDQLASVADVGRRFIINLESSKENCQLKKVFLVLRMLGVELIAKQKNE